MAPISRRPLPTKALGEALLRGSATQPTTLLDAFMGYVSTFFHDHDHSQRGSSAMPGFGMPQPTAGRRNRRARAYTAAPLYARDTVDLCDRPSSRDFSSRTPRRNFHNYFVTHLPSSSLHPDSRTSSGPGHKLPRSASTPHTPGPSSSPAITPPNMPNRDLTVVRIPLRSAKHHFGVSNSRGQRSYNEDTNQAGTIDMPAFAKRAPISLVRSQMSKSAAAGEGTSADSAFGDPQIFYFAAFDGHGGSECSEFLRDELHGYIEQAAAQFELGSSLKKKRNSSPDRGETGGDDSMSDRMLLGRRHALGHVEMKSGEQVKEELQQKKGDPFSEKSARMEPVESEAPILAKANIHKACQLEAELLQEYKSTVGGYFRRFHSTHFSLPQPSRSGSTSLAAELKKPDDEECAPVTLESVLTYAFLRADLDFITAQARKPDPDDPLVSDFPLNRDEILGSPHLPPSGHGIGGQTRFKGGSTASVALISTPTPAPFWHPAAHSTLVVAHVGDTRILLCKTATGLPRPLTSDHHPSSPTESRRLRRYAAESLITDSFGEERISGLANSRAFGDMQSKRIGVSAEPEICRVELGPAEYSFLVLMSDGVSGTLSDEEIVDVIKEAHTPEEGARKVVEYATEISSDGDNATCLVVRLGGWERRSEGGLGSLGTKEMRDMRRAEALDPRRGRR
ncbi:phosphatase 2C-like domain-containing protein [Diplogelasinospora grovesii]|uniref:Phosphatase 2C-like domain-containing protein n=1 Tax=Diplogelasinospora grovesii TaxID=303347 RepID=A0AAN6NEY1_9PEZI|nr:phosphatase 2C-like domain-containing protein [Diplogelasinospora grovesii]